MGGHGAAWGRSVAQVQQFAVRCMDSHVGCLVELQCACCWDLSVGCTVSGVLAWAMWDSHLGGLLTSSEQHVGRDMPCVHLRNLLDGWWLEWESYIDCFPAWHCMA